MIEDDEMMQEAVCGECRSKMQAVRPGKWQCLNCEEKDQLKQDLKMALELLQLADGNLVVPSNSCCSCHINPPCSFCVENSAIIEFKSAYKNLLLSMKE